MSHNIDPFCFLSFVLDLIDKALVFQVKDKDHEKIIVPWNCSNENKKSLLKSMGFFGLVGHFTDSASMANLLLPIGSFLEVSGCVKKPLDV